MCRQLALESNVRAPYAETRKGASMREAVRSTILHIAQTPGIAQRALASAIGVSTRTVRSYLREAEAELEGVARIEHDATTGYRLEIDDASRFAALVACEEARSAPSQHTREGNGEAANAATPGMLPQTRAERVTYLIENLLCRATWTTLDALSAELYISRKTLSLDLKDVEEHLSAYSLTLERRPRYGIRVSGDELARRACLAGIIAARGEAKAALAPLCAPAPTVVSACVDEMLERHDVHVTSISRQNLIVHLVIAIARTRSGAAVPLDSELLDMIRQDELYPVATELARSIEQRFDIELPASERAYLTLHLEGRRTIPTDARDGLVISDEIWTLASRMIERASTSHHIDLTSDLELRMNLARHLIPLGVRLTYGMRMANPLLADIKNRFPLAFAFAQDGATVLAETYGTYPSEEELGYLALAFALALERRREQVPGRRILIVCASGAGSARLLAHRYQREFGAHLASIETCDVSHINDIDLTHIDYVFTTVPLPCPLPVPVRDVTAFLDDSEVDEVRDALMQPARTASLIPYVDERLFFYDLAPACPEELLRALCGRMTALGMAPSTLLSQVLARETAAPTAFGGLVALPHPLEPVADETHIAVALLKEPLTWNDRPVRAVFLVSLERNAGAALDTFYEALTDFISHERAISALLSNPTFSQLIELLEEEVDAQPKRKER